MKEAIDIPCEGCGKESIYIDDSCCGTCQECHDLLKDEILEQREQWFIDRIGQTIYRTKVKCDCNSCKISYENGIEIKDKEHANFIFKHECELGISYFETKEERNIFELALSKHQ